MRSSKDLREVRAKLSAILSETTLDLAVRRKLEKAKREFDNLGEAGEIDRRKVYLLTRCLCELLLEAFAGDSE